MLSLFISLLEAAGWEGLEAFILAKAEGIP
jgi:hypothetical protein